MRSRGNCRASQWHIIYYLMSFLHITIGINAYCITEICSCQLTEWGTCWGESELPPLPALALVRWQSKEHCTSEVNILPMNLPVMNPAEGYRALEMETLAYSPLTRRVCACCLRAQLERWGSSINAGWSSYSTFHITCEFFINSFFLLSVPRTFSVAHFFGPRSKLTRRTFGRNRIKISSPPWILCQNISLDWHNADEGCWTLERTILNKCIQLYLTYGFQSYINLRI